MSPRLFRAVAVVLASGLLLSPALGSQERVKVVAIVDGDTVRVLDGGGIRPVRLIGIDTPEHSHPSKHKEFMADEASEYLASLCGGKTVLLERGDEDVDSHGRLLRYIFLPPPDGRLVNLEMVRNGYARVYRRFPFSREGEFSAAEEEARREGRGIWREGGIAEARWARDHGAPAVEVIPLGGEKYAVVCGGMVRTGVGRNDLGRAIQDIVRLRTENADGDFESAARKAGFMPAGSGSPRSAAVPGKPAAPPPLTPPAPSAPKTAPSGVVPWEDAHLYEGRNIVVEGTIVRTHRSRKVLFLNFHPNWKKYMSVVIFGKDLGKFPKNADGHYKGKKVRVSGKVKLYKGRPEIVVRSPKSITVVD